MATVSLPFRCEKSGVFGKIAELAASGEKKELFFPDRINPLILSLTAGTEGFLSNASMAFAREWVMRHFQIDSIFSLPAVIFSSCRLSENEFCLFSKNIAGPE